MKKVILMSGVLFMSLSLFAKSSQESVTTVSELSRLLKNGQYTGLTDAGRKCNISVVTDESSSYTLSLTPDNFIFGQDDGSSECMYTKACVNVNERSVILNKEVSSDSYLLKVERPGGGPDLASDKVMSVKMTKFQNGLKISVTEKIGFFNLGKTTAECHLFSN